ncbi:flagellar basal body rod protein FlgC [Chitinispirillales bacterium ANBcel5]|uniref:flagellar basal body rod protein FlgC n=1 Tax=Cellulosispirillum alkaliphilum TaxID=3039283 RepID=UPI002A56890A|nr:flagellar basal body rod protein FlgC [Chitinispirillales bacterium ANBcel5]
MSMTGIFSGLSISASGMRAQRTRQNTISSNLANAETTRTPEGGPYRRQFVVFNAQSDKRDVRILNKEVALEGRSSSSNHMPIPSSNFPRDERFFGSGVEVSEIREDSRPARMVHDPAHPDADERGYVAMPNVNVIEEMTNMIAATRAYEANVTAFNATKSMLMQALQS